VPLVGTQEFDWHIETNGENGQPSLDLGRSNIFNFSLYVPGQDFSFASSTWFNLTNSTVATNGSIISAPTSTLTSISSTITASTGQALSSTATTSSSLSSSPTPLRSGGLDTGGKISVGLGVGLGVPLLLAVIAGVYILAKRSNRKDREIYLRRRCNSEKTSFQKFRVWEIVSISQGMWSNRKSVRFTNYPNPTNLANHICFHDLF